MWWRMGERYIEPELMDHAAPAEARQSLGDLIRINAALGGHATVRDLVRRARVDNRPVSILDVGAASGDSAEILRQSCPHARVVSLDRNEVNLTAAPAPKLLADAFTLPFRDRSFDFVLNSLFLHHFENEQVVAVLREFRRVAREAVLICDLERHRLPYWFMKLSNPFYQWHWMTVHDGRISVRAAFAPWELAHLAMAAGLTHLEVRTHRPAFRISVLGRI
jgi:ubiquinone/menaquinone biosynthesis C-methylase UbiE